VISIADEISLGDHAHREDAGAAAMKTKRIKIASRCGTFARR
jgi:hypothetical protein